MISGLGFRLGFGAVESIVAFQGVKLVLSDPGLRIAGRLGASGLRFSPKPDLVETFAEAESFADNVVEGSPASVLLCLISAFSTSARDN